MSGIRENSWTFARFSARCSVGARPYRYIMKKILGYRRLLGVHEKTELRELKTIYRNLMKTWHPDSLQDNPEKLAEAEVKSKEIIEAYHFLVSIAPETRTKNLPEFTTTITTSAIVDYNFKVDTLTIEFADGNKYEFFGVTKDIYNKLMNAPAPARFVRRHISDAFIYRNVTSSMEEE